MAAVLCIGFEATSRASVIGRYTRGLDRTNCNEATFSSICMLPENYRIRYLCCWNTWCFCSFRLYYRI